MDFNETSFFTDFLPEFVTNAGGHGSKAAFRLLPSTGGKFLPARLSSNQHRIFRLSINKSD
jgi:hypothetical protein